MEDETIAVAAKIGSLDRVEQAAARTVCLVTPTWRENRGLKSVATVDETAA